MTSSSMNMTPIQLSSSLNLATLGMSVSLFGNPPIAVGSSGRVPAPNEAMNSMSTKAMNRHFREDFRENYLAAIRSASVTLESELTAIELSGVFRSATEAPGASPFPPPHCLTRYEWKPSASEESADRARHLDLSIRSLYAGLRSGRIGECMLVLPPTSYMGGGDRVTVVIRWRRTVAADQDITKGEGILEAIQSSSLVSEWKQWHEAGISFENLSISKGISELSEEAADVTQRQDDDATQEAHADELTCELLNVLQHGGEKVNADFGTRAKKGARLEQQERAVRFRGLYAVTAYMDHLRATLVHQALRRHQGRVSMPVIIASHSFDGATLSPVEVQVTSSSVLSSTSKETQDATALYTVRIAGPILLDNVLSLIEACSEHRRKPFKTTFDCDPKCHFGLNAFTRSRDRGRLTRIEFDPADGWCLRFEPVSSRIS
ncbi:hypothetical protein FOZ60_003594 [Perkinsus olseni]|uniref:Uncharacterized protein n=1 Tax=Perkinsus olseni TaxID=32597 RepID=A0A7J6NVS0_PEROL|nr:hypothetical protein FOZ60_003594 [Perkinsus olseni]